MKNILTLVLALLVITSSFGRGSHGSRSSSRSSSSRSSSGSHSWGSGSSSGSSKSWFSSGTTHASGGALSHSSSSGIGSRIKSWFSSAPSTPASSSALKPVLNRAGTAGVATAGVATAGVASHVSSTHSPRRATFFSSTPSVTTYHTYGSYNPMYRWSHPYYYYPVGHSHYGSGYAELSWFRVFVMSVVALSIIALIVYLVRQRNRTSYN